MRCDCGGRGLFSDTGVDADDSLVVVVVGEDVLLAEAALTEFRFLVQ